MTDELKRAAEVAGETLGMSVEVVASPITSLYDVLCFGPMDGPDGEEPILSSECLTERAALAYLDALTQGARIMRERHAGVLHALKVAVEVMKDNEIDTAMAGEFTIFTEALSQLED